jgi:4'-phosphopantetheinyl transferase
MPIPSIHQPISLPSKSEVHVWRIGLGADFGQDDWCESTLSHQELERAHRFVFERDRVEFIQSHAAMRVLLESYGIAPANKVALRTSHWGKPELDPQSHSVPLEFNLTHARGIAVCAFAYEQSVGIDVELLRIVNDADEIVKRHFSPEEQAEYSAVATEMRPRAFLNAWTRKEAFVKALGLGLGHPLESFAVTLGPGSRARLLHVDGLTAPAEEWTLEDLTADSNTIIALAVRSREVRVVNFEWAKLLQE